MSVKRLLWAAALSVVVAVGLAVSRAPVDAHHASGPFYDDTKSVEAVGTVARFVFRNPHSFLFINGPTAEGEIVEWEVELGAAVSMRRQGWTPETIRAGDPVKAVGQPSRAPGTHGICCAQITRPDGSPIRP
jgi:hypothetical protein